MEEPNIAIRSAIFLSAGGDAGLWGMLAIAVIVGAAFWPRRQRPIRPLLVGSTVLISGMLIVCSSIPWPTWFQILTVVWLLAVLLQLTFRKPDSSPHAGKWSSAAARWCLSAVAWLSMGLACELPYRFWSPPTAPALSLLVIGDSVTAGLNDGEDTWPQQLSREAQIDVLDASQPGATLKSARHQNELFAGRSGLVILEIGGNDMLEGLPVPTFAEHLQALLTEVNAADRTVVMFELPLPPLCAGYGFVQRELARQHHVTLIPKRHFAAVLTTSGATVDGIHLSRQGQTSMMQRVRRLFDRVLAPGTGYYERLERRTARG